MTTPTDSIQRSKDDSRAVSIQQKFPADLGSVGNDKQLLMMVYKYTKESLKAVTREQMVYSFALPMPDNLQETNALTYSDTDTSTLQSLMNGGGGSIESLFGIARRIIAGASGSAGALASREAGSAINPHTISTFDNVPMKTYSYEFKLIAKSQRESDSILNIINRLRLYIHPDVSTTNRLDYPHLFKLEFLPANTARYLYKHNICAVTGMNVSYNGGERPVFFKDSGAPVEVTLSIQFKEMVIDTAESIFKKNNQKTTVTR